MSSRMQTLLSTMWWLPRSMRLLAILAIAVVNLSVVMAEAQSTPSNDLLSSSTERALAKLPRNASLLDAWSIIQRGHHIPWANAFIIRRDTTSSPALDAKRLIAELEGLHLQARLMGDSALANGVATWQQRLSRMNMGESRQPGRSDPAWLMANLRHTPRIREISALGWCKPVNWVEVWSPYGVRRIPWKANMTTETLLDSLSKPASGYAEHLHIITTLGEIQPLSIAPWNYHQASLAPGSRITIELPLDSLGARWLDTALPRFLSTRLPGDDCVILSLPDKPTRKERAHVNVK